jgi:hypothetical protein
VVEADLVLQDHKDHKVHRENLEMLVHKVLLEIHLVFTI